MMSVMDELIFHSEVKKKFNLINSFAFLLYINVCLLCFFYFIRSFRDLPLNLHL